MTRWKIETASPNQNWARVRLDRHGHYPEPA